MKRLGRDGLATAPRRLKWFVLGIVCACGLYAAAVSVAYRTIPAGNTSQSHFNAIIVLGTPSNLDGSISFEQRERVLEGVAEYRRHVADNIIMTGGAAHNRFVEAHTMALFAESSGVPADAVIEEGQARNTIENIFYSMAILRRHGWASAEIVSSSFHLPRAALILAHWPLAWRTHAAAWPREDSFVRKALFYFREALECWRIRTFGFTPSPYLPPLS